MPVHDRLAPVAAAFRRRRLARFCRELAITPATTVLDVGGVARHWDLAPVHPRLTLVNTYPVAGREAVGVVVGDGCRLPFRDQSVDVVYANSVIEHLGSWARQRAFAHECARVGRRVWVQTPDFWSPLEPHFVTPFVHWLPPVARRAMARYATVWGLVDRPTPARVAELVDELRLLTAGEVRLLFPDCRLVRERMLGLPKSLTAVLD